MKGDHFYLKTKDFSVTQESFELYLDENLEMLVTSPQPEQMDPYYDNKNYISHNDEDTSLQGKLYYLVRNFNVSNKLRLIRRLSQEKKILDVGAGTGTLLSKLHKQGWSVLGVEPNTTARDTAAKKGVKMLSNLSEVRQEKFAIITLWHVLEHMSDLESVLKRLDNLLTTDGTIIVAVPNFKSFDAKYYKEHWAAYDVPRHLSHFSKHSISKLFGSYDMEIVSIKPMLFDAFYIALLSEKYKYGKLRYLKAFYIGLVSNMRALVTKEYSSMQYLIKRKK